MAQSIFSHKKHSGALNNLDSYEVGQRLRLARLEKGLKQKDLIQDQFSKSYISSIEAGRLLPSPRALEFFSLRLGVSISFLQWGSDISNETLEKEGKHSSTRFPEVHRSPLNRKRLSIDVSLDLVQIQIERSLFQAALDRLTTLGLPTPEVGPAFNARFSFLMGQAEYGLNNLSSAIPFLNQAQEYAQSAQDSALFARSGNALADCYFKQKNFREALTFRRQALEAIKKGEVKDPIFEAKVLYSLAGDYTHTNEQGPALAYLQEASTQAGHLIDRTQAAFIYQDLSLYHQKMGNFPEAKFFAGKSLAILVQIQIERSLFQAALDRLTTLGLPTPEVGPAFNARFSFLMGQAEYGLNNLSSAIPFLNQAQEYAQSAQDSALFARSGNALADCYFKQKNFREALTFRRQALEAIKKGEVKDPIFEAKVLYSLAGDYTHTNEQGPALAYLQEASTQAGHLIDRTQAAFIYQDLSLYHQKMGNFPEAKFFAGKSLAILEDVNTLRLVVELENKHGQLLFEAGRFREAEGPLQKALKIANELKENREAAIAALNLSQVYMNLKDPDRENEYAWKSVDLAHTSSDIVSIAKSLLRVASMYAEKGELEEAEKFFNSACETLENQNIPQELGALFFDYGRTLMNLGRDREAAALFEKAYTFQSGFPVRNN